MPWRYFSLYDDEITALLDNNEIYELLTDDVFTNHLK